MTLVRTLIARLEAEKVPATWGHTGGGCYAVEVPLADGGELLVVDREGPWTLADLDSDEEVYGFYVGRFDAEGSPFVLPGPAVGTEEGFVYASPEGDDYVLGSDLDDVVEVVRELHAKVGRQ